MENRVPLPTDNIFKFYALFGLFLFVFSVAATIYVNKATNAFLVEAAVELETLKSEENLPPGPLARKQLLSRSIEVEIGDKKFAALSLRVIACFGALLMFYGFSVWHQRIQPLLDAAARLQVRKLELEVQRMERDSGETAAEKT